MDLESCCREKIAGLMAKGVSIPDPLSLDIGDEVDIDRIAGQGVVVYPGCRIYGANTVICPDVRLGAEGPVTIDDCALGAEVELKGGSFRQSVFLEKASMGPCAQVREGCLLEEEASGAHCVGLKQTILFPFVTVGSLVNFCDCLMAGGTSRKDHSEVGSSYVHFNYTPAGDKATASLFGDVARGVMLDRRPIFLEGGQGGAVGPVRVGYGTVVAAGSVLREDVDQDGLLVVAGAPRAVRREYRAQTYLDLSRVVRNNVLYLANLTALEGWYRWARRPFFERQDRGALFLEAALELLARARDERVKRLLEMADKVPEGQIMAREFKQRAGEWGPVLTAPCPEPSGEGETFLTGLGDALSASADARGYVEVIQGLDRELVAQGTRWLQAVVDKIRGEAGAILTTVDLIGDRTEGGRP